MPANKIAFAGIARSYSSQLLIEGLFVIIVSCKAVLLHQLIALC